MKIPNQEKVWDELAEQWNNFRQRPFKDVSLEIEKIIQKIKPGKILDLGCGNCRNLLFFAKEGFDCYGVDFSQNMLNYGKEFAKKNNFNVKLKKAQLEKIPFKNNNFDYLLSIATLHHLNKENQEDAVKEMYRILRVGGIAIVSVWNKWPFSIIIKQKYEKWHKQGKIYHRYYYFFTPSEIKKLFLGNGFEIISMKKDKNIILIVKKNG